MRRNHIVVVNKAYPPWIGGIERHVQDTSEALVARGWRVTALVCNRYGYQTEEWLNGVHVIRVPRIATVYSQPIVLNFIKQLVSLSPDLVHVHVPFPLGWLTVNAMDRSIPILCTWHSDIIRQRWLQPLYRYWQQRFLERCHTIFVTSEALLKSSTHLKPFEKKCVINHLSVPPYDESKPNRLRLRLNQLQQRFRKPIILFVGRLVGYKGVPVLLRTMDEIDALLILIGDGPMREKLMDQAKALRVENKVVFLGAVSEEEKQAWYGVADIFVLPSISNNEAFGYVALEAMQRGCPVVSTDLPTGIKIVNIHQQTGLVVQPNDAASLTQALKLLVENESLRRQYGIAAEHHVKSNFNFSTMIDRIERVYSRIFNEPTLQCA